MDIVKALFQLTKPSIMLLVVFTGLTALTMEGSLLTAPRRFGLVLLGLYLCGGCANALNQYFEREVDARMRRTRDRRPLPSGRISPTIALIFSLTVGVIGILIFALFFNALSTYLAVFTILFYSLFYTLWLKPNTPQNIVVGGIAGAMGPLVAWAAAANTISLVAIILFLIVFLWTPPHFWSLALYYKDDYKELDYPMMPVAKGEVATLRIMAKYTVATVCASMTLVRWESDPLYIGVALVLGCFFLHRMFRCLRQPKPIFYLSLFRCSIMYLFGLFLGLTMSSLIS